MRGSSTLSADQGMPFLLQFKNVSRYEDGKVIILDRRVYPARIEYVTCEDYRAVAQAIRDMVTQSYGPWAAAAYGMVSAAHAVKDMAKSAALQELERAAQVLSHARPTTSRGMAEHIHRAMAAAALAVEEGRDAEAAALDYVEGWLERRYQDEYKTAGFVVDLLPEKPRILTQCFADTYIAFVLLHCQERGKDVSLICPETRPYLQGARLTASVAVDMGVPTTLITDNMPGFLLSQGMVDAFICAADVVTLDGWVVNKVGTYQIALAAHQNNVPFYVLSNPSASNPTIDTVKIEERDPEEVTRAMGVRTAKAGVRGYYPAFDMTPPNLVSAVVTSKGLFSPYDLKRFFV